MVILFAPPTWQPVQVRDPNTAKNLILQEGYRRENPLEDNTKESPQDQPISDTLPVALLSTGGSVPIKINSCSLEELIDLKGVGTVLGKKIMAARPYKVHEDLIAVTDRVDWLSLNIDFSQPE